VTRRALVTACCCVLAVVVTAACGKGERVATPLARVPAALVPDKLDAGDIRVFPQSDNKTVTAFANAGKDTLQADARLWELRQGDRLVGALQITTVVPKLDLADAKDRRALLKQILPGALSRLDIGDQPVWATVSNDKVVYVWFGRGLFEVLQLKGSQLQPEAVLTDVVRYQTTSKAWVPLPAKAYDEKA
jgi:hypothetical protein